MSRAWLVARVRGVDLNIHARFVSFLVWIALAERIAGFLHGHLAEILQA
jgi:hypothetical protein